MRKAGQGGARPKKGGAWAGVARGQEMATRGWQGGARAGQGGARAGKSGARAAKGGARPGKGGARAAKSGAGAAKGGARPAGRHAGRKERRASRKKRRADRAVQRAASRAARQAEQDSAQPAGWRYGQGRAGQRDCNPGECLARGADDAETGDGEEGSVQAGRGSGSPDEGHDGFRLTGRASLPIRR
ncbi:unnamed protein product [Closterium sp. NIES-64]|nr:unnamed protein product [Closterium sp. NIES-64]